jgi:hypothetical protein
MGTQFDSHNVRAAFAELTRSNQAKLIEILKPQYGFSTCGSLRPTLWLLAVEPKIRTSSVLLVEDWPDYFKTNIGLKGQVVTTYCVAPERPAVPFAFQEACG